MFMLGEPSCKDVHKKFTLTYETSLINDLVLNSKLDQMSLIISKSFVGSAVERLKRRARDQHGLDSKPTRAILLCPWERHFTAHYPAWWFWQAVLNHSYISIKLQGNSNILISPEVGRGNCLP